MTYTLSTKELQDFRSACDKWCRERENVFRRAVLNNALPNAAAENVNEWEKTHPFPRLSDL